VLDAGCGIGENAVHVASLGLPVLGFDGLRRHWRSPGRRPATAESRLSSSRLTRSSWRAWGTGFDTVLDYGLFHTLDRDEQPGYVASLASATEHGGTLYVLCFSDEGPGTGPHPITREELRMAFNPGTGWTVAAIEPDRVQTRYHDEDGAPAWLATINRI
jgi:cyclopropane fatty-acyl-phospholipid synthase-like methyltransferase